MIHLKKRIAACCRGLDLFIENVNRAVSWLGVALVFVIMLSVVLRYAFDLGLIALEEAEWYLFGVLIMFGLSYDVVTDRHIRLDLLHRKFSRRGKCLVEILGILFMLMPLVVILVVHGVEFVADSFALRESSVSPLGLPCRWAFKAVIPLSMLFLGLAAFSRLLRSFLGLFDDGEEGVENAA